MPTVALLAKTYDGFGAEQVERIIKAMLSGLKVEIEVCGVTGNLWVQTSLTGEDETVALRYLSDRIGLCPENITNIQRFLSVKGFMILPHREKNALYVDLGIFSPRIVYASIPLHRLQAQLADGRKMALEKLAEIFGLCENLPMTVKILSVDADAGKIEAELSETQQALYRSWTESLLDRLLVMGATSEEIRYALERAGFARDFITIEPLGIFEHAVVCKLGTDAVGLIPKIGRRLRRARFSVFDPKKVLRLFGEKLAFSTF
jgi:hypothetical protein